MTVWVFKNKGEPIKISTHVPRCTGMKHHYYSRYVFWKRQPKTFRKHHGFTVLDGECIEKELILGRIQ